MQFVGNHRSVILAAVSCLLIACKTKKTERPHETLPYRSRPVETVKIAAAASGASTRRNQLDAVKAPGNARPSDPFQQARRGKKDSETLMQAPPSSKNPPKSHREVRDIRLSSEPTTSDERLGGKHEGGGTLKDEIATQRSHLHYLQDRIKRFATISALIEDKEQGARSAEVSPETSEVEIGFEKANDLEEALSLMADANHQSMTAGVYRIDSLGELANLRDLVELKRESLASDIEQLKDDIRNLEQRLDELIDENGEFAID